MIYVLLLVVFMKSGLVLTHSVTAPALRDCYAAKPLIQAEYAGPKVKLVKAYCLGMEKPI